jgi:hypothetical protein
VDDRLRDIVAVLVVVVEACGAAVIIIGALWAFVRFLVVGLRRQDTRSFVPVRLTLGRFRSASSRRSPPSGPPSTTSWARRSPRSAGS